MIELGLKGSYILEIGKENQPKRLISQFDNLILNAGLNRIASNAVFRSFCQIGTGTTQPSESDVALTTYVANTGTMSTGLNTSIAGTNPYVIRSTMTFRFPVGSLSGEYFELGVGWASSGSLFSKTRIKDLAGNDTSIRVMADEYLDVTYILEITPKQTDTVFNVNLRGTNHECRLRPANINQPGRWVLKPHSFNQANCFAYDGNAGNITTIPSGTSSSSSSVSIAAYVANSFERNVTLTWLNDKANFASGIKSILIDSSESESFGCYQIAFNPPILKTNVDSFNMTLKFKWARS